MNILYDKKQYIKFREYIIFKSIDAWLKYCGGLFPKVDLKLKVYFYTREFRKLAKEVFDDLNKNAYRRITPLSDKEDKGNG